jgi:hypothetical protein
LLFLDLAKQLSEQEILRLYGVNLALLVLWLGVLSRGLSEGRSREEGTCRER